MSLRVIAAMDRIAERWLFAMKISSIDGDAAIELIRGGFDDPADIDLRVHGNGFSGANYNVFPLNTASFLDDLSILESSRKGLAVLSGTEGFELTLESIGGVGEMSVEVALERACSSSSSTGPRMYTYRVMLGFTVAGENVGPMIAELRRVLTQERADTDGA